MGSCECQWRDFQPFFLLGNVKVSLPVDGAWSVPRRIRSPWETVNNAWLKAEENYSHLILQTQHIALRLPDPRLKVWLPVLHGP